MMKKKLLFVASECVPYIKTGGLADVCGALPKEFDSKYWDIKVILPNYTCIAAKYREQFHHFTDFMMDMGPALGNKFVGLFYYQYQGITYYFVDNLEYFDCKQPYGDNEWDIQKFLYFDKAVLSMLPVIDFKPDIIHCHDWQTGYIPVFLQTMFQANPFYHGIKTIFTIHNLRFQGVTKIDRFVGYTGLPYDLFGSDKLGYYDCGNMLKGALVYADYITTVSSTYCGEIQTPQYGENMDGLLRARSGDMQGIVNGIDYASYDPATDEQIYAPYDATSFRRYKKVNKEKLQEELGLSIDSKKYMIGLVSRLTDQKGLDLVNYCMEQMIDVNTQLVVIGTGEPEYENMFRHYAWKYPDRVSANILYSDALSRKVYAAADAFLVPSAFEPCGLTQLISFRYGTIPIVRETGGLKDTVAPYNEYDDIGDGFTFSHYSGEELLDAIRRSKHVFFTDRKAWNRIAERDMRKNYSWANQKQAYEDLYHYLIG